MSAWAYFIECHRPGLRAAARVIAGESAGAELADSIYAELYGLEERDGAAARCSDYFHGRSRLSTWLRSILAQRNVDRLRAEQRLRSLDDDERPVADPRPAATTADPDRARFARLAQDALAARHSRSSAARPAAAVLLLPAAAHARPDRPADGRARGHGVAEARPGSTRPSHGRSSRLLRDEHKLSDCRGAGVPRVRAGRRGARPRRTAAQPRRPVRRPARKGGRIVLREGAPREADRR